METIQTYFWWIGAVASTAYLLGIFTRYGIVNSISASFHYLKPTGREWLYMLFILFVAIPMMLVADNTMGWWAGALLMLDFAAPSGGNKLRRFLHYLGAQGGMILGVAQFGFIFHHWLIPGVLGYVLALIYGSDIKHKTWWVECVVLWTVLIGLFIEKIL